MFLIILDVSLSQNDFDEINKAIKQGVGFVIDKLKLMSKSNRNYTIMSLNKNSTTPSDCTDAMGWAHFCSLLEFAHCLEAYKNENQLIIYKSSP